MCAYYQGGEDEVNMMKKRIDEKLGKCMEIIFSKIVSSIL